MRTLLSFPQLYEAFGGGRTPHAFRTWINRLARAGRFPAPLALSVNRCAWDKAEIEAWLESRPRRHTPDPAPQAGTSEAA